MLGNSLAFQQLGLSVSTAGLRFQFPVRKLRSLKPDCTTKKKKKERKKSFLNLWTGNKTLNNFRGKPLIRKTE